MGSFRTGGSLRFLQERIIDISNLCQHRKNEATESPGPRSVTGGIGALIPCPQLSAGEMKFETATPRPGRDRGCRGAKTIHLSFGFLRASVPPWCKGFVFAQQNGAAASPVDRVRGGAVKRPLKPKSSPDRLVHGS